MYYKLLFYNQIINYFIIKWKKIKFNLNNINLKLQKNLLLNNMKTKKITKQFQMKSTITIAKNYKKKKRNKSNMTIQKLKIIYN